MFCFEYDKPDKQNFMTLIYFKNFQFKIIVDTD